jgi:hypothetical protein
VLEHLLSVSLLAAALGALAPRGTLEVLTDNVEYARAVADCAAEASRAAAVRQRGAVPFVLVSQRRAALSVRDPRASHAGRSAGGARGGAELLLYEERSGVHIHREVGPEGGAGGAGGADGSSFFERLWVRGGHAARYSLVLSKQLEPEARGAGAGAQRDLGFYE